MWYIYIHVQNSKVPIVHGSVTVYMIQFWMRIECRHWIKIHRRSRTPPLWGSSQSWGWAELHLSFSPIPRNKEEEWKVNKTKHQQQKPLLCLHLPELSGRHSLISQPKNNFWKYNVSQSYITRFLQRKNKGPAAMEFFFF